MAHFYWQILSKFQSNRGTWNCSGARTHPRATLHRVAPRRPPPSYARARTPRPLCDRRSEAGRRGYCVLKGYDARLAIGRCHAVHPHASASAHRGRHWPATPPTTPLPFAHIMAPVDDEGWAKPPLHAAPPIKPHPFLPCASQLCRHPILPRR
jgi:hypothetical protein